MTLRVLSIFLGCTLLAGCVDAPVNFESEDEFPDLSSTIFPLVEGSYWSYQRTGGGIPVDNPMFVSSGALPFPLEIEEAEMRYYYLDDSEVDRVRNYGPAPVWLVSEQSLFQPRFGYLANDTMVVWGWEYGERYGGTGMLVQNPERYMPLKPVPGVSYRGLSGSTYIGTEMVTTPGYSGEGHVFASEEERFIFAEGVGLVLYSVRIGTLPLWFDELELTDYRIGF